MLAESYTVAAWTVLFPEKRFGQKDNEANTKPPAITADATRFNELSIYLFPIIYYYGGNFMRISNGILVD
jgi:hypothetical protein